MKRHLLPDAALAAIIFYLLAISHASPIPLERLVPQENSPLLAASTSLSKRDDSLAIIASRANEGESSMTQHLREHGGKPESSKRGSTSELPSTKRARLVLPPLRPLPSQRKSLAESVGFDLSALEPQYTQSSTQAVVADVETPSETGIPSHLTGEQANIVLQVLDSTTADDKLPWNTQEPYRWSSETKQSAISYHGYALPSNPHDDNALNARLKELWTSMLEIRATERKQRTMEGRIQTARKELLEKYIDGSRDKKRPSLLAGAIQEGNEPWRTASNWEEAERVEKWGKHDWKWTQTYLKEVLESVLTYRNTRMHDSGRVDDPWKFVNAMNFQVFKNTMEDVWKWYLRDKKSRRESNAIRAKRRTLDNAGLASLEKYLLPERKTDSRII